MITREKLEHHISHLQEKHDVLDKQIWEMDCHYDESVDCHKLKKHKLKIKDQIERFKKQLQTLT